ncbi:MAG TPA: ribonuclease HIII [Fimbriimonadaceae bacterium]|nr:ribonuclease HIII [Fimbriimonadaceae bacterium]
MADERIGVDESGKGDFFGPLVIAACFVGPWHCAELEGVQDSKKLTDKKAAELAKTIKRTCPHEVVAIGPAKYNELYAKIGNLNRLLAWGHARAIEDVLSKQPCDLVISDQFADPAGLKRELMEKGRRVQLVSMVRAESDLAVAAASVLARAEFLSRLKRLGSEIGIDLPKGAGPAVDQTAARIIREKGEEALAGLAKLHFKTVEKARALAKGH